MKKNDLSNKTVEELYQSLPKEDKPIADFAMAPNAISFIKAVFQGLQRKAQKEQEEQAYIASRNNEAHVNFNGTFLHENAKRINFIPFFNRVENFLRT